MYTHSMTRIVPVTLLCIHTVVMHSSIHHIYAGSPVNFEVKVEPANNFPIDLYLLMDLSTSMTDDLVNLKNLGTQLGMPVTTQLSMCVNLWGKSVWMVTLVGWVRQFLQVNAFQRV